MPCRYTVTFRATVTWLSDLPCCWDSHFPPNFDSPYKADSVTDFWHRWHISLSTWLRDYLYISLGGNRKGKIRTYINLILTMLLGGLWHGASWNFVVWGGLHGVALALHKFFRNLLGRPKQYRSRGIRKFFAVVLTFHFVCFCWIFFRNSTFEASVTMIRQIFTAFHPELLEQLLTGYWKVFALMGVGFLLHFCPDSWQKCVQPGHGAYAAHSPGTDNDCTDLSGHSGEKQRYSAVYLLPVLMCEVV